MSSLLEEEKEKVHNLKLKAIQLNNDVCSNAALNQELESEKERLLE